MTKIPGLDNPNVSIAMRDTITRLCATPFGRYALKTDNARFRTAYTVDGEPIDTGYLNFSFFIPIGDRSLVFHVENGPDVSSPTDDHVWLSYCFSELDPEIDAYIAYRAGTSVDEEFLLMEMEHAYRLINEIWVTKQISKLAVEPAALFTDAVLKFLSTPIGQYCFLNDLIEIMTVYHRTHSSGKMDLRAGFKVTVPAGRDTYVLKIYTNTDGTPNYSYGILDPAPADRPINQLTDRREDLTETYFNDLGTLVLHAVGKHSTNVTTADYI